MDERIRTDLIYAAAGVAAGVVFGIYGGTPMLEMIGSMVRSGATLGWVLHLIIAGFIGLVFGEVVQWVRPEASASMLGIAYGVTWWVLGPLLMMPLILGMPQAIGDVPGSIPSLWGHIIYGATLQAFGQIGVEGLATQPRPAPVS